MIRFLALSLAAAMAWFGCQDTIDVGAQDCGPVATAPDVQAAAPEEPSAPPPAAAEPDALEAYLLDAELAIVPLKRQVSAGEPEDAARARYHSIAHEVAGASRLDGELAFPGASADVAAARFGLVLVAIAAHETGLALALDGDSAGCTQALGGCDGGWASSLWQVHARRGHDRAYYLRLASSIAARSLHESGGLCWYTASCGRSTATRDIEAIYRARWAAAPWKGN